MMQVSDPVSLELKRQFAGVVRSKGWSELGVVIQLGRGIKLII